MKAGDGKIYLTVGRLQPGGEAVQCGRRQAKVTQCRDILSGMQAGMAEERFGLASDEVDVKVPYRISTRKSAPRIEDDFKECL